MNLPESTPGEDTTMGRIRAPHRAQKPFFLIAPGPAGTGNKKRRPEGRPFGGKR
jgi:hypothetical protein